MPFAPVITTRPTTYVASHALSLVHASCRNEPQSLTVGIRQMPGWTKSDNA